MTALLTVFSEEQLAAGDPVEPPAGGDAQGATGERPPTGNRLEGSPTTTALREPPASPPEVEDDAWDQKKNGLQIADLVVGDGPELQKGQVVTVEYTGWVVESGERFASHFLATLADRGEAGDGSGGRAGECSLELPPPAGRRPLACVSGRGRALQLLTGERIKTVNTHTHRFTHASRCSLT